MRTVETPCMRMVKYIGQISANLLDYTATEGKVPYFLVGAVIWLNLEVDRYNTKRETMRTVMLLLSVACLPCLLSYSQNS